MVSLKQMRRMANATDDELEAIMASQNRAAEGFAPPNHIVTQWFQETNDEIGRVIDKMDYPEMVSLVLYIDNDTPGLDGLKLNHRGFDYVNARLKHPDTPESERNDLRRVRRVYQLVSAVLEARDAIDSGDSKRLNRIISRRAGVRA